LKPKKKKKSKPYRTLFLVFLDSRVCDLLLLLDNGMGDVGERERKRRGERKFEDVVHSF
jgi:hypothetical protein